MSSYIKKKENTSNKQPLMTICQLCSIQKEVKSNPSSQTVKKCAAPKKAIVKKDVKSKVVTKKWL